jgi:hypothetical protein
MALFSQESESMNQQINNNGNNFDTLFSFRTILDTPINEFDSNHKIHVPMAQGEDAENVFESVFNFNKESDYEDLNVNCNQLNELNKNCDPIDDKYNTTKYILTSSYDEDAISSSSECDDYSPYEISGESYSLSEMILNTPLNSSIEE